MTLEEKREIVSENKDVSIAALNAVLDRIYDLKDMREQRKTTESEMEVKLFDELEYDSSKYENVRAKLLKSDFNLSLAEINYVALAYYFCAENIKQQVELMDKARQMSLDMVKDLMSSLKNEEQSES